MNKYKASFKGRFSTAIGITYCHHAVEVWGEDEESARINLYDTYDHIEGLKLVKCRGSVNQGADRIKGDG